jgi:hypothetical protein
MRKVVQITGNTNLGRAIMFSKYNLRLPYAKG